MLPYGLAIAVALSSFILFITAFFMPKIHRQDDFFWSGLGFFYALVLWFCAPQIKGAVLLGQLAAVALLISYSWQIIQLRKVIVNPSAQKNLDGFSVTGLIGGLFNRSPKVEQKVEQPKPEKVEEASGARKASGAREASGAGEVALKDTASHKEENLPIAAVAEDNVVDETVETVSEATVETTKSKDDTVIQKDNTVIQSEKSDQSSVNQELPEEETATVAEDETESTIPPSNSEKTEKKSGLFDKLIHFGKKEPKSTAKNTTSITNTRLDELLDEEEEESESEAMSEPQVAEVNVEETIVAETVIEEETNWDFLDEEPAAAPEKTTNKEEELEEDSVNESSEETIEQATPIDPEKPASEGETK